MISTPHDAESAEPSLLRRARLPAWLLPDAWPRDGGDPVLADIGIEQGRIASMAPSGAGPEAPAAANWDLAGAPVLPAMVDAHTHLDCAFTRGRIADLQPGLLAGIAAKAADRVNWTENDLRRRAQQALGWAFDAGTAVLRSHVDWLDAAEVPTAWSVFGELAAEWAGRVRLERVSLCQPRLHADRYGAQRLARQVAASPGGASVGSFIHTSNWNRDAVRHLVEAAADWGLQVDLHVDEELDPGAQGLAFVARLLREMKFEGRVVCGHNCALSAQSESTALATLDAVAQAPITLVSLPQNNLLLQDAVTGRTPRWRGITLLKEARARGIPLLIASDSVQDPFCAVGSFDPVEAFAAGVLAGQLDQPFDRWSDTICRSDWLRAAPASMPLGVGEPCDLVIFHAASASAWPSRAHPRTVLRHGRKLA